MRERQAELSRSEILLSARRLFAERGFARTSVRDIAQAAGVSTQTVYNSFGSKQAVVARLNDLIDSEAGIGAMVGPIAASRDPQQVAALSARITRSGSRRPRGTRSGDLTRAAATRTPTRSAWAFSGSRPPGKGRVSPELGTPHPSRRTPVRSGSSTRRISKSSSRFWTHAARPGASTSTSTD